MIEWFLGEKFPASEQNNGSLNAENERMLHFVSFPWETEMLSPLCALLLLKPMDILIYTAREFLLRSRLPSLGPRRLRKSNKVLTYLSGKEDRRYNKSVLG